MGSYFLRRRMSKYLWKSQTVAKRQYGIGRREIRTYGGRPTGIVEYSVVRFAVARTSGKWYLRLVSYPHQPRTLKEAKALAQEHAKAFEDTDQRNHLCYENYETGGPQMRSTPEPPCAH
jgi:hypothetical protein